MAALQTLRNKPVLLMSVIGGALLLFIVTMVLENQSGRFMQDTDAGEAYGNEISIQDFESKVAKESNLIEFDRKLRGDMGFSLNEDMKKQVRQMVWEQFVINQTIQNEADELGLSVSENDLKEALNEGKLHEVQFLMLAGQQTVGIPTIEGYKQFLTNFDKTLSEIRNQRPELEDFFLGLRNACMYCETKIKESILADKYSSLMKTSFTTSELSAKMELDENALSVDAEVVSIPYSTVSDSAVKVTEQDIQNKYNSVKKKFYTPCDTRHLKYITVNVTPSPKDIENLHNEMAKQENALAQAKTAEDVAIVVSNSKTTIPYTKQAYFKKEAFNNNEINNIQAILDTMTVGHVKKQFNDANNTITTLKLVDKVNTADSLYVRQIVAMNKTQADSIIKVLSDGSKFGEVAKGLGQPDTTVWINYATYVSRPAKGDSSVYTDVSQLSVKTPSIITTQGYNIVTEVLEKKSYSDKYNVAVIKYQKEYSKETYDNALSKLNNFLANNKNVKDFSDNAAKEGYFVFEIPNFSSQNLSSIERIKGEQANLAIRWALDEAEVGDVSNVFECPENTNKAVLLAAAIASENTKSYTGLDNEKIKELIEKWAIQDKKAEMLSAELEKGSFADAAKLPNAMTDSLINRPMSSITSINGSGYEPTVLGALQKAEKGEMKTAVKGAYGVYRIKMENKSVNAPEMPVNLAKAYLNYNKMSNTFGVSYNGYSSGLNYLPVNLLNTLQLYNGEVKDNRYKFNR